MLSRLGRTWDDIAFLVARHVHPAVSVYSAPHHGRHKDAHAEKSQVRLNSRAHIASLYSFRPSCSHHTVSAHGSLFATESAYSSGWNGKFV